LIFCFSIIISEKERDSLLLHSLHSHSYTHLSFERADRKNWPTFQSVYDSQKTSGYFSSIKSDSIVSLYAENQEIIKVSFHSNRFIAFLLEIQISFSYYSIIASQQRVLCESEVLIARLHLPRTYVDHVKNLAVEFFTKRGKWVSGSFGRLFVGSCIYIVCRRNQKPITLLDIAVRPFFQSLSLRLFV
jgi:hypothetical protein